MVKEKDAVPVSCALSGQSGLTDDCWTVPVGHNDRWTMTIHHPDGGFRRFVVDQDGTISAADGASSVIQTRLSNGSTEIAIDGDRYRLPASQ